MWSTKISPTMAASRSLLMLYMAARIRALCARKAILRDAAPNRGRRASRQRREEVRYLHISSRWLRGCRSNRQLLAERVEDRAAYYMDGLAGWSYAAAV